MKKLGWRRFAVSKEADNQVLDERRSIGAILRARRRALRLSQGRLGWLIGRSQIWVSGVERGLIRINQEKTDKILAAIERFRKASHLEVRFDDLRLPNFENRKISRTHRQKGRHCASDSSAE